MFYPSFSQLLAWICKIMFGRIPPFAKSNDCFLSYGEYTIAVYSINHIDNLNACEQQQHTHRKNCCKCYHWGSNQADRQNSVCYSCSLCMVLDRADTHPCPSPHRCSEGNACDTGVWTCKKSQNQRHAIQLITLMDCRCSTCHDKLLESDISAWRSPAWSKWNQTKA